MKEVLFETTQAVNGITAWKEHMMRTIKRSVDQTTTASPQLQRQGIIQLSFDEVVKRVTEGHEGLYTRFSDDIVEDLGSLHEEELVHVRSPAEGLGSELLGAS